MQAIEMVADDAARSPDAALAQRVIDEARHAGLLVSNAVCIAMTTQEQVAEALQMLEKALAAAC
jgi:4-aminobutyrate aminotransferase/(S)-3-amino-2-methylpropionate transaminase